MQAHPLRLHVGDEQPLLLQQVCVPAEAVAMELLHPGDIFKQLAHQGKPFFHGGAGEGGVVVLPLLVLVVLGGPEIVQQVGVQIHWIGAVHPHGLATQVVELAVKLLGVGLFLLCGEQEQPLDHGQAAFVGDPGGDGIAAAGLALPGEGAHQILSGLTGGKDFGSIWHGKFLLCIIWILFQYARKRICHSLCGKFTKEAASPCLFPVALV